MVFILTIYLQSLILHGVRPPPPSPPLTLLQLAPPELSFSTFLPIGPCGQTAFSLLQLSSLLRTTSLLAPLFTPTEEFSLTLGLYGVSVLVSLMFYGMGIFWLGIAIISISTQARIGRTPFSLGWFGLTFPLVLPLPPSLLLDPLLTNELKKKGYINYLFSSICETTKSLPLPFNRHDFINFYYPLLDISNYKNFLSNLDRGKFCE